jgi:hypothetical protein
MFAHILRAALRPGKVSLNQTSLMTHEAAENMPEVSTNTIGVPISFKQKHSKANILSFLQSANSLWNILKSPFFLTIAIKHDYLHFTPTFLSFNTAGNTIHHVVKFLSTLC